MKNNNSIKPVVAVGIGAALFFVLGRFAKEFIEKCRQ